MFCVNWNCENYTFSETYDFIGSKEQKTQRLIDEIVMVSLTKSSLSAAKYLSENMVDIKKSSICYYFKNTNSK